MRWARDGELPLTLWVGDTVLRDGADKSSARVLRGFPVSRLNLCSAFTALARLPGKCPSDSHSSRKFSNRSGLAASLHAIVAGRGNDVTSAADIPVAQAYLARVATAGDVCRRVVRVIKRRIRGERLLTQAQLARSPPHAAFLLVHL